MANQKETKENNTVTSKVTTVCGFIKHYSSLSSEQAKEKYQSAHITRKYCPVIMKRALLEEMVKQSVAQTDSGIPYIDMMISKINFIMAVVALYTDLLIDRDENDVPDTIKVYDALVKSGIGELILNAVGEDEIQEMINIQDGLLQTFEQENHSTEAVLLQQVDRFAQMFGLGLGYVQDALKGMSGEEIQEKVKEFQDGIKGK